MLPRYNEDFIIGNITEEKKKMMKQEIFANKGGFIVWWERNMKISLSKIKIFIFSILFFIPEGMSTIGETNFITNALF